MTWWQKVGLALTLAYTGKQAAATVATVATAGVTAAQMGLDPVLWAIGAAGSTVVYAKRTASSRADALANGVVSVFLAGVGAPYVGAVMLQYFNPVWSNEYVLAGVMSVAWPWAAPVVWKQGVGVLRGFTGQQKGGRND
jgi:hypothetical protein